MGIIEANEQVLIIGYQHFWHNNRGEHSGRHIAQRTEQHWRKLDFAEQCQHRIAYGEGHRRHTADKKHLVHADSSVARITGSDLRSDSAAIPAITPTNAPTIRPSLLGNSFA